MYIYRIVLKTSGFRRYLTLLKLYINIFNYEHFISKSSVKRGYIIRRKFKVR